jgi:NADH-quinone oxidoreductase subunit J
MYRATMELKDVKRQDVLAQMYRDPAKAMELKDVKPGQGL